MGKYGHLNKHLFAASLLKIVPERSISTGQCAHYVAEALKASGLIVPPSLDAWKFSSFLKDAGFAAVSRESYRPQVGDVVVWLPVIGHPVPPTYKGPGRTKDFGGVTRLNHMYGHVQGYAGGRWVSDFRQNNFEPGGDYCDKRAVYEIYRQ